MASQGFYDWVRAGRPYTLIRPARAVQTTLRRYGLTVYDYPDDSHQKANTPQDHTPYSVTGWPGSNRRWNARALDVMPRSGSALHRNENADIARQLIRDRDAGHPGVMWIKYINWTDEAGVCRQERWTDSRAPLRRSTVSSTDKGHIHISGRSDADTDTRADTYDPIARMRGNISGGIVPSPNWNDAQKANAAFNNDAMAPLDTDGTPDGTGNIQLFPNKTHAAIKALEEEVAELKKLIAAVGGGGGTPESGGISEERARQIAREEVGKAEVQPGPL